MPRIGVLEPYCTAMWAAMPSFTHPELLHVPFWADRLTIALVAGSDFRRALWWCARVQRLPPPLARATAPSLWRSLTERQQRCRRALTREAHGPVP